MRAKDHVNTVSYKYLTSISLNKNAFMPRTTRSVFLIFHFLGRTGPTAGLVFFCQKIENTLQAAFWSCSPGERIREYRAQARSDFDDSENII